MSLVHQMLHAAMAEEGDEDDEVKEAYGVQMEETLAALKARLEEAKRGEGLVDSTAETDTKTSTDADRDHSLAADEGAATLSNDRIEAGPPQAENGDKDALRLAEREQILLEQLEGADISETDEITPRELKVAKLELLKVRSDFESLQASSEEEVSGLEETIESLTKRLHSIQASHQGKEREADSLERINEGLQEKIRELESSREKEISYYRERFGEQQNGQTQLMEAKDTEIRARQEAIQALEAKVDELQASKQCGEQYSRQIVEPLQDRMRQQHEFGERELSRHRAATEALETRIVQCEQALEGHKRENSALEHQLSEAQASKEREVNHLQEAIEALQDKIRQLNETKERELQDVKQSLAQEHEDAVSKLRLQLDNALVEKEADIKQQAASKEVGESSIQELRNTYQSQLEQLRATLASIHASNTELRHDLDNKKKGYEEEVSNLKTELERSAAEALDLRDEMKVARQQFSDLGEERNMAQSTIEADAEVLKQLSDNVASLQQQLTTSHNEEIALLEKNVQAEKELAMTKKLLEDLQEEKQRLSAAHELESKSARNLRADLERRCFNAQEAYNDLELEHATVQSQMDSLGADLARGSGKGNAAIERKLVKLCVEVEKAKEAKTELENQLEKAQAESEKHKTRIRELDSALKVTTAELVELRTERPNGSNYSGSPVSKAGLRSSRWAKEDHIGDGHRDDSLVGEELSSHIQGQV